MAAQPVFQVNLVSAEQISFNEFLMRIPEISYVASVRLEPLRERSRCCTSGGGTAGAVAYATRTTSCQAIAPALTYAHCSIRATKVRANDPPR